METVSMDKDLSTIDQTQIDDYLTEVEVYINSIEKRGDVLEERKARAEQFIIKLKLSIKKQNHLVSSWKRYHENAKRKYFRSWKR